MRKGEEVEEADPLKQGLKPDGSCGGVNELGVEEADPLKQGLKPLCHSRGNLG